MADFTWGFYGFSYPVANADDLGRGASGQEAAETLGLDPGRFAGNRISP